MPDVARRVVGRYEILRELGRGGMSTVHLARQTDLDCCVALKELHAIGVWDPSFPLQMLRESQVVGSLSHPNIVAVFDCFERDGTPYIAMEYVERGSLRPYVGRMTLAQIGGVLEGLLAGLRHAEAHRIVHRDLKPENLMVTADGRVKIADFGIAKAIAATQTGESLTVTGVTVGTPGYMAPEQAMAREIGPWTDLYSVGCIAFELFAGRTPFDGSEAPIATLLRQVNEPIPPVKSLVPDVDAQISDWIERLLVKKPAWRTQRADDAWAALEEILVWLLGPLWRRDAPLVAMPARRATGILDARTNDVEAFVRRVGRPGWSRLPGPARDGAIASPTSVAQAPLEPVVGGWTSTAPPPEREPAAPSGTSTGPAQIGKRPEPAVTDRPSPARTRRSWALSAAIAVGIAAITGVAASALGTDGRERRGSLSAQPAPVMLLARGITLEVPVGWRRDPGGEPVLPGVGDGIVARGPDGQRIVFGRADRSWSNHRLLPDTLHAGRRAQTTATRHGGRALRYDGVRIAGRSAFVYSVPTTKGVATVTCFATAQTCSAIGASLQITAGKVLPLGPDPAFINDVGRVLGWLEARERPVAAQLRRASTPASRVAATKKLWWTYAGASKRLRRLDVGPADSMLRRQLAEALRLAGCAYGRAAGHHDLAGYEREGELALVHQADVRRALDGLLDAGYKLPSGAASAARFTRLPALVTA
jgi:hypothetical protein